jgi:DNA repair exonuclease SbcCD ATPase subunit
LLAKDEEINSLKKQIQAILQRHTDGGANASHYQNFLEQQAKELANAKKHLQEYENRNEECKRKWNQLIKENINKEEKVKGLTLQLNRQIETYQGLYSETDAKIAVLYTKFAQLVSQDEESRERDAAEFLVSQMKQIQDEREKYASENEQLHLQTQELIEEIKRLSGELQEYQKYFDKNEMNGILEGKPVNAGKMKSRIEELEDLVYEVKQREGARKTVELSDIIVDLERKYTYQVKLTEELKNKLVE